MGFPPLHRSYKPARRAACLPRPPRHKAGSLAKYARLVDQANHGAVTHPGAADWPWFDW